MLFDLIQLLSQPEQYVCNWRDTELYIEPVEVSVASVENNNRAAEETVDRRQGCLGSLATVSGTVVVTQPAVCFLGCHP